MTQLLKTQQQDNSELIASPTSRSLASNAYGLTEPEKAAIIISLLGADSARPIVEEFEDQHLRSFMRVLENMNRIPHEAMLAVVADFITELKGRRGEFKGGAAAAKELVKEMFPEDRVERLYGTQPKPETSADVVWSSIAKREPSEVAKYLETQKSAVAGVVLSQLPTESVGNILSELPENFAVECVSEMSRSASIGSRTIEAIAQLAQVEFLSVEIDDSSSAAAAFIGDVLGVLPRERRDKMLEALDVSNAKQAVLIRASMLTFEDLRSRLPVTAIPMIFKDFDQGELIRMLKAGAQQEPEIVTFFYENISQRMANDYKDQVFEHAELTQKEGDTAISSLMSFISKMEKDGRIVLNKPVSDEEG